MTFEILFERDIEISYKRIEDILVGAFEGGSNYWFDDFTIHKEIPINFDNTGKSTWFYSYPLNKNGKITFRSIDNDLEYVLDLSSIKKGLKLMAMDYKDNFNDIITEDDDADTSDLLLQLSLFDELVYG